ncbi:unnamed protein product [Closterium sp. Yama58-4]|nr:unnamed protein product [Closterium sp. Yama58-4]
MKPPTPPAAAPPPARTVGASAPAAEATRGAPHPSAGGPSHACLPIPAMNPGDVQVQGAPSGAHTSAVGHTGLAASASSFAAARPVAAACVSRVAAGQHGASAGAPPTGAGQHGASAGAPPDGAGQPGASAGAPPAGEAQSGAAAGIPTSAVCQTGAAAGDPTAAAGQTGAAAGVPTAAAGQIGAAAGVPSAAAGQTGAPAGFPTAAVGQTCAAAGDPTAAAGQTGAPAGVATAAAGQTGAAAGVATAAVGQTGAAAGVATAAVGQTGAAAGVPSATSGQTGAPAGVPAAATGHTGAAAGVPSATAGPPGAAAVAPTTTQALPGATASDSIAYAGQKGPSTSATHEKISDVAKTTTEVHHLGLRVPSAAIVPHHASVAPPGSNVLAPGLEARVQAATGRPINAPVVQPRNDVWDIGGPHTKLTIFHPGISCTRRGGVSSTSAAPSGPIGHALQPPNVFILGSGQPHASVQVSLSSHRPPLPDSAAFLVSDEALDNVSGLPGHTAASRGRTLSSMLTGFVQGSQPLLPSPAASTSIMPSTQGGENGEEGASRGFTGVTKKQDKDEWIARIVLDRTSQSLIVINSHFGSEVEAARSIAAASHVMFIHNPMRGDLIPLTANDKAKIRGCTTQQCEIMVRIKFWHMWEEWRVHWPAAKAKWDEKMRRADRKRAALQDSLGETDDRPDKIARTRGEASAGAEIANKQAEGAGSKAA